MTVAIYIVVAGAVGGGVWFMRKIARELTRSPGYRTNQGRFIRLPRSSNHRKRGL